MKLNRLDDFPNTEIIINKLLIIGIGIVFLKLVTYHFQVISNFFPNEYRESAILMTTDLMLKGGEPYALVNQPQYTNVYGIFYHIIVLPFAQLFGVNFPVHRAISGIFIFASCFLFFIGMRARRVSWIFSWSSTLILYGHLLYFTTPLARPDSLGFFLFLSGIFIPWYCQYSCLSLLANIILGILGFITKPYFILPIIYLSLYLFIFKSKKAGIKHGVFSLVFLVTTFFIINFQFETYFNNVLWINWYISGDDFVYAIKQLYAYIKINYGVFLIFIICIIFTQDNIKFLLNKDAFEFKKSKPLQLDFSDVKKPLINRKVGFIEFCLIISCLIFLTKLGQHWGSWLIYIHHLISPFLIFLSFDLLNEKIKINQAKTVNLVLNLCVLLNLLSVSSYQVLPQLDYNLQDWNKLSTLLSQHQHIFNSPAVASILMEQGKKVYDSGQSQYFGLSTKRQFFWDFFIPPRQSEIQTRYEEFMQEVTSSVKANKYDLIVLTKAYSPFITEDLLKKYYQYQETLIAPMSVKTKRDWELEIWTPKNK